MTEDRVEHFLSKLDKLIYIATNKWCALICKEVPNEEIEDEVITHGEVENETDEVKLDNYEAENETSWLALEDTKQEKVAIAHSVQNILMC